jgi:butyryl-CoA dehydrogenase
MALMGELNAGPGPRREAPLGFLAAEAEMVAGAKKTALMCIGLAAQKYGEALSHEQEILGHFADLAMETYALESAVLRTQKRAAARGEDGTRVQEAAVRCFAQDALDRIETSARRLLAALAEGDTLKGYLGALARFTRRDPANTVALRRQVAAAAIEAGRYPFT